MSRNAVACVVLALLSVACVDRWTEVRVAEPTRVAAQVTDRSGARIELRPGAGPASADAFLPPPALDSSGPIQRVTLLRLPRGELSIVTPDTDGHGSDTLIGRDGVVASRRPLVFVQSAAVTGDELRMTVDYGQVYGRSSARFRRTNLTIGRSFEVTLRTPLSNVEHAERYRRPSRALGGFLFAGAAVLGGVAIGTGETRGSFPEWSHGTHSVVAGSLGAAAVALGMTAVVLCFGPESRSAVLP